MTQTSNRFFDEIARLMNDAAGVATGVRREFDTLVRTQADRMLRELDLVQREEFEAVKEMARMAREENEVLLARLTVLEARLASAGASPVTPPAAAAPRAEAPPAPAPAATDSPPHAPSAPPLAAEPEPPAEPPPSSPPSASPYGPGNPPTS
jgi:BMFP domain-containing protein YqiC